MRSLLSSIRSMIRWAEVTLTGADDGDFPIQQVTYLGKTGDAFMHFPYGYHANIPREALALMLSVSGRADARVALACSPMERPTGTASGEVVVFHPLTGSSITFKSSGDIEIETAGEVTVTAPTATLPDWPYSLPTTTPPRR